MKNYINIYINICIKWHRNINNQKKNNNKDKNLYEKTWNLPTPGYGIAPGYAACGNAASPFGSPCAGIDKWSASKIWVFIEIFFFALKNLLKVTHVLDKFVEFH